MLNLCNVKCLWHALTTRIIFARECRPLPPLTYGLPSDLSSLIHLSARIGSDLTLTQGAGGNTSIKHDGALWVKASGMWLAEAEAQEIFVPVELDAVTRRLEAGEDDCGAGTVLNDDPRRASIEASVHAVLPHRVVVHVHCVETIAWAVRRNGEDETRKRLAELAWMWVPYRRPGAPLARQIVAQMRESRVTPSILVLENHGLVVCAPSCEAAERLLEQVRMRLATAPRTIASLPPEIVPPPDYRWATDSLIAKIAADPTAISIARKGVLYPDHAVFLGGAFSEVGADETIETALARWQIAFGSSPAYLVVLGVGVLLSRSAIPNQIAMLQCLSLVTSRLMPQDDTKEDLRYLSEADVAALLDWDAEAYRRRLAVLGSPA
jgi:rhamnose utilization protein RhaD (predicted bifunctional aldolase and dehydrogenase)